jgi:putative membrane protein
VPLAIRPVPATLGAALLLFLWAGPLPGLAARSFAAHMALHLAVVAAAAPLLALGLVRALPRASPVLAAPVAATTEMVAVWAWHVPALCTAARGTAWGFAAEQATWLAVGLLLWASVLAPGRDGPWAGIVALLLTAMHMALLGALIAFAPRLLYPALVTPEALPFGLDARADQALGGVAMLAVGGTVYAVAALALAARQLGEATPTDGPGTADPGGRPSRRPTPANHP